MVDMSWSQFTISTYREGIDLQLVSETASCSHTDFSRTTAEQCV